MRTVQAPNCPFCGKESFITTDDELAEQINAWRRTQLETRPFIQDAFPDMPAEVREQLITGAHPACWAQIFGLPNGGEYEGA